MVHRAVYRKLIEVAKARQTIPFVELGQVADMTLESDADTKTLGLILDNIADYEVAAGRPLLPVLVVNRSDNMPGAGLFEYAKRKKLQTGDNATFFATELTRVYDHWATAPMPRR